MSQTYLPPSQRPELRLFTCPICNQSRTIPVRQIEKWVVVCLHPDSRGSSLPIMQRVDEGAVLQ